MLCKPQHFVNVGTIKSIYYTIFHSHLSCVCTSWVQNLNSKHCINLLQIKAMQIINLTSFDAHTSPIFAKLNIINKFPNLIYVCNCLFIQKHFLFFFSIWVFFHSREAGGYCSTSEYDTHAFAASAIKSWNFFQKRFSNNSLRQLSYSQLKLLIENHFFNSYNQECSKKLVVPLFQTNFKLRRKFFLA